MDEAFGVLRGSAWADPLLDPPPMDGSDRCVEPAGKMLDVFGLSVLLGLVSVFRNVSLLNLINMLFSWNYVD